MPGPTSPATDRGQTRMGQFRELAGGTAHELGTNPGLRAHLMRLGSEAMLGAGVLAETSNGRRFSFSGFAEALSSPKEAFSGAMERAAPHAAAFAGHAALVAAGHVMGKRAERRAALGEAQGPAAQA